MYINITETHPLALNLSEEVLLHFEVQWDKSTQPNAISINSSAKSIMVHRAQRHSSLQCSNLQRTCSAEDRSSAAAQHVANLDHGSQLRLRLGSQQREGTPKQVPGEDVLGGRGEAGLGSFSGGLRVQRLACLQRHSMREETLTENEPSGKKVETFTGTLLSRCVFGLPGEKVIVCHVLQLMAVAPTALFLPGLLAVPESQGLYFNTY